MLTDCRPYVVMPCIGWTPLMCSGLMELLVEPLVVLLLLMCTSSLNSLGSRNTTVRMTPLMCSSDHRPSRMRWGRPRPFGRRSDKPPSIDGPSMLCTRFAYSTNVGYGMSYFRAAWDNVRPSLSTLQMASAIVSGRQDFKGPRSRKRWWWMRFWLVFQHFCHIDCSWYW